MNLECSHLGANENVNWNEKFSLEFSFGELFQAEMVMPNDSVFSASHGFVRTGIGKSRGQGICILPIAQWRKVLV